MNSVDARLRRAATALSQDLERVPVPPPPRPRQIPVGIRAGATALAVLVLGVVLFGLFAGGPTASPPVPVLTAPEPTTAPTALPLPAPTTMAVQLPAAGPAFGEETGQLLLVDDGLSGLTAVDFDRRLAARSPVDGQRPGDEQYSMERVGDHLVVGWGGPHAVDIATRQAVPLGNATIFVPAAEQDRVWLVDYAGSIGANPPTVWQVGMGGQRLTQAATLPAGAAPEIGVAGGMALATETGLDVWNRATGEIRPIDGGGHGFALDSLGDQLAWCSGDCEEVLITDVTTFETDAFHAPNAFDGFAYEARFSPDGRLLAALVENRSDQSRALWLLDVGTGSVIEVASRTGSTVDYLAWSPDGSQLFATSYSHGLTRTAVWRYVLADRTLSSVVLPFGGAMAPVVVDDDVADAYLDPADPCEVDPGERGGTAESCTFGF